MRKYKKLFLLTIVSFLLSGCVKLEDLSAWDPEKAWLQLPPEVLGSLLWLVLYCTLPALFLVGAIGIVLTKRPDKRGLGLVLIGLSIGLIMALAAAPYIYLPTLEELGRRSYPAGLTPAFVFDPLKSESAKLVAFMVPFGVAVWELSLVVWLIAGAISSGITGSWKPLVMIFVADLCWLLYYPLTYVELLAAQTFLEKNVVIDVTSDLTKVYDLISSGTMLGNMMVLFVLVPCMAALVLLLIPGGSFKGLFFLPIPMVKENNVYYAPPDGTIYGNPPSYPQLPEPRDSGDFGGGGGKFAGGRGLPVMDGTIIQDVGEEPLPEKRPSQGRDEKGSIITPPPPKESTGDKVKDKMPSKRDVGNALKLAGTLSGHPEVTAAVGVAEQVEDSLPQKRKSGITPSLAHVDYDPDPSIWAGTDDAKSPDDLATQAERNWAKAHPEDP